MQRLQLAGLQAGQCDDEEHVASLQQVNARMACQASPALLGPMCAADSVNHTNYDTETADASNQVQLCMDSPVYIKLFQEWGLTSPQILAVGKAPAGMRCWEHVTQQVGIVINRND